MNLFLVLDGKLQNEFVRFKKPHTTRKKLKASAISLEKTLASTETSSQKPNLTSKQNRKPQSQHSDATLGQKQKLKESKQAKPEESTNLEKKKPRLRCYNCDKMGHIVKECYALKKKKKSRKSLRKSVGQ